MVPVASPPRLTLSRRLRVVSGQEDSAASSGDTVDGPSPEDGVPQPWGLEAQAAPWPCPGERGALAAVARGQAAGGRASGQRPGPGRPSPAGAGPGHGRSRGSGERAQARVHTAVHLLVTCPSPARHHAGNGISLAQPLLPASWEPASSELDPSPRPLRGGLTAQSGSSGTPRGQVPCRDPQAPCRLHVLQNPHQAQAERPSDPGSGRVVCWCRPPPPWSCVPVSRHSCTLASCPRAPL